MKRVERALGLGGGDGEQAGAVDADGVEVHRVEIAPDLLVDLVLARLVRLRQAERLLLLRRGLAVVLVVVPPVADGLAAVHQHVEAAALVAVEVLHAEAGAVTGPLARKSLRGNANVGVGRTSATRPCLLQAVDESLGGVRRGLVDEDGSAEPLEGVGVGVGLEQRGAVAEVAVGVPQRGEHQVQLLPVIAALAQRRGGLDEQHLAVGVLAAVASRARAGRRRARGECRRASSAVTPPSYPRRRRRATRLGLQVLAAVAFRPLPAIPAAPRAVAQLGSALDWGSRGRRFESCQPDRRKPAPTSVGAGFCRFDGLGSHFGPVSRQCPKRISAGPSVSRRVRRRPRAGLRAGRRSSGLTSAAETDAFHQLVTARVVQARVADELPDAAPLLGAHGHHGKPSHPWPVRSLVRPSAVPGTGSCPAAEPSAMGIAAPTPATRTARRRPRVPGAPPVTARRPAIAPTAAHRPAICSARFTPMPTGGRP